MREQNNEKNCIKKQNEKHDNVDDELELIVRIRSSCGFEKVKMILQFVLCCCLQHSRRVVECDGK